MNLLNQEKLQWSTVVANNTMNRERVAFGINSYEKEIKFNPINFLENRKNQNNINWVDLCCGSGNALWQVANFLEKKSIAKKISITGIDLIDYFSSRAKNNMLILEQMNLDKWKPKESFDLITIIHGLHYLGDKIKLILTAAASLKEDGLFIGNLDLNNILIEGVENPRKTILNFFKKNNIQYDQRRKLISITGSRKVETDFRYLGADDKAGPNYTGQPVVNSFYEMLS